jgi:hypothetical protein
MMNYNGQLPPEVELDDILPQINTNTKKNEKYTFDSRNYLNFAIPEGKKTREITIRLLPVAFDANGKEIFFQIVHLHSIPVHQDLNPNKGGKKAYMCLNPKNTAINHEIYGNKCPVCEAQQEMWKLWHDETDETKKKNIIKEINALNIREYCIIRCIERGNEAEGPKFWRIPIRQDQTDAFNKIVLLARTRKAEGDEAGVNINILCPHKGRDLKVTFTEGTGAPTIVDKSISTPLTTDAELFNKWYYDEKKWSDVFSTTPYDYLKVAFEGQVPWFDKTNNRWTTKDEFETNKSAQENVINNNIQEAEAQFINHNNTSAQSIEIDNQYQANYYSNINNDDDLPF